MSTYGWILLGTVLFPLIFSFEKRIAFYRRWPPILGTAVVVSVPFLAWDAAATLRGDWSFASAHVSGWSWFGLPLEEYLFFIAVPFSCQLIFAAVLRETSKTVRIVRWPWFAAAGTAWLLAVLVWPRTYSAVVLVFLGAFLLAAPLLWKRTFFTRAFWWTQLLCVLPFLVVDGVLTGLPVVSYRESSIVGIHLLSIPLEDLVYSFVLVGMNVCVSEGFRRAKLGE